MGYADDESAAIAKSFWSQRPGDSTMLGGSQSLVLGIGNQWIAGAAVLVAVIGAVVALVLTGSL